MNTVSEVDFQGFQLQMREVAADPLPDEVLTPDCARFNPDVEMEMLDVASRKLSALLEKWYDCAFVFEIESI